MSKNSTKKDTAPEPMDPKIRENRNPVASTNNKRACYAIKQLVFEVEDLFPETVWSIDNYDGRNTALDVTFQTDASPGLAELLSLVEQDGRVAEVIEDRTEQAVLVAFRPNTRTQDSRAPFGLGAAWLVLGEGFDGESEESL